GQDEEPRYPCPIPLVEATNKCRHNDKQRCSLQEKRCRVAIVSRPCRAGCQHRRDYEDHQTEETARKPEPVPAPEPPQGQPEHDKARDDSRDGNTENSMTNAQSPGHHAERDIPEKIHQCPRPHVAEPNHQYEVGAEQDLVQLCQDEEVKVGARPCERIRVQDGEEPLRKEDERYCHESECPREPP